MPVEILMPALSPTMTEGNLAKWIKKEGDKVKAGDVIAEIETDKAIMEVEAVDEGILAKILVAEGTEAVKVNQLIALLLEEGEDASKIANYTSNSNHTEQKTNNNQETKSHEISLSSKEISNNSNRIIASPLAKRIASQEGIDLSNIDGTGPHGRIIKADIADSASKSISSKTTSSMVTKNSNDKSLFGRNTEEYIKIPNNNMRKVIAKRLCESKQTVPHFYLSIECEIDSLLKGRQQINSVNDKENPLYKISVNDMVIKAVAMALRDIPEANSSWTDEAILQYNNIDVSVAVAIDGGLITPIIRNADKKSLSTISNEMKDLAARAKTGKLSPEEFQGGGFSISNLGMFGIKNFNAIINPPQSCILAIGASCEKAIVKKGEIKIANIMEVTLSCDHRVVDGAIGAKFLASFKRYVENPMAMMV